MAIYEQNWGLGDVRKSEFQVRIETSIGQLATEPIVQAVSPAEAFVQ
jgi:hypothetical protein